MRYLRGFFNWLERLRLKRILAIDKEILWPACLKSGCGNRAVAMRAFMLYTSLDRAWTVLTPEELEKELDTLK